MSETRRAACDRCHGQKMRCLRGVSRVECNRCLAARAECVYSIAKKAGRPSTAASKRTASVANDDAGSRSGKADQHRNGGAGSKDTAEPSTSSSCGGYSYLASFSRELDADYSRDVSLFSPDLDIDVDVGVGVGVDVDFSGDPALLERAGSGSLLDNSPASFDLDVRASTSPLSSSATVVCPNSAGAPSPGDKSRSRRKECDWDSLNTWDTLATITSTTVPPIDADPVLSARGTQLGTGALRQAPPSRLVMRNTPDSASSLPLPASAAAAASAATTGLGMRPASESPSAAAAGGGTINAMQQLSDLGRKLFAHVSAPPEPRARCSLRSSDCMDVSMDARDTDSNKERGVDAIETDARAAAWILRLESLTALVIESSCTFYTVLSSVSPVVSFDMAATMLVLTTYIRLVQLHFALYTHMQSALTTCESPTSVSSHPGPPSSPLFSKIDSPSASSSFFFSSSSSSSSHDRSDSVPVIFPSLQIGGISLAAYPSFQLGFVLQICVHHLGQVEALLGIPVGLCVSGKAKHRTDSTGSSGDGGDGGVLRRGQGGMMLLVRTVMMEAEETIKGTRSVLVRLADKLRVRIEL